MRRTLTVAALAAAMLVPAAAASADTGSNASCSNGKGGNSHGVYSGHGNVEKAAGFCVDQPVQPIVGSTLPTMPVDLPPSDIS